MKVTLLKESQCSYLCFRKRRHLTSGASCWLGEGARAMNNSAFLVPNTQCLLFFISLKERTKNNGPHYLWEDRVGRAESELKNLNKPRLLLSPLRRLKTRCYMCEFGASFYGKMSSNLLKVTDNTLLPVNNLAQLYWSISHQHFRGIAHNTLVSFP